jgi:tetratricopeptide (TPR) repeat protein
MMRRWRWILLGLLAFGSAERFARAAQDQPPQGLDLRFPPEGALDDPAAAEITAPLRPRTSDDRARLEAARLYATARALERRWLLPEAIALLERARAQRPEDAEILRRLGRLHLALGRIDEAAEALAGSNQADPTDVDTMARLFTLRLEAQSDPAAARALLRRNLDRTDPRSAAALLARRLLGDLAYELDGRTDEAADSYAAVLGGLTAPESGRLAPSELQRILHDDPPGSFMRFGDVLLRAGRYEQAVQAYRRGLAYEPNHPLLPRLLAEALLGLGRGAEALETLETYLKRQPQGREPYDLLGRILEASGRGNEFLPRLKTYAEADSKNLALQLVLAEQFRAAGRAGEAEALLRSLLRDQGDPLVLGPLVATLIKEKKADALIQVFVEAAARPGGLEIIAPQIEALANDRAFAAEVLDRGLALYREQPPRLTDSARQVLAEVAHRSGTLDPLIAIDRLALERDPSARAYRELFVDLYRGRRYDEAGAALDALFEKHPAERNAAGLDALARCRLLSGRIGPALDAAREAEKLEPNDPRTPLLIGYLLVRLGRHDEAIAHYKRLLEKFAGDADFEKDARMGLSSAYVDRNDYAQGEAELEALLAKDADDPGVNNDLGYLYAEQGKDLERAEAMIRKALEEDPENASYLDSLGWVLYKRDKLDEAIPQLEKASAGPDVNATRLDHLGDAYFRLGRHADARRAWARAADLAARSDPPEARLQAIRRKLVELDALTANGARPDRDSP